MAKVLIIETDISSDDSVQETIKDIQPDELYHLAACHHSSEHEENGDSKQRTEMFRVNFLSTQVLLNAAMEHCRDVKFLYAGSRFMYVPSDDLHIVNEQTPFAPANYYGLTKTLATELVRFYREAYGMWSCTAILFNHESIRRHAAFVSRRISQGVARVKLGLQGKIELKNPSARVDWGNAEDFVYAMFLMLSAETPKDYVVATGELHTVADFASIAFSYVGLDWQEYVESESQHADSLCLLGDPTLIKSDLGWKCSRSFHALVEEMVESDLLKLRQSLS